MATIKKKGERHRYWVRDRQCISAQCLALGLYQHRGATMSGSRNTGSPDSPTCMTNAYHGCPACPKYSTGLAAQRRALGMRVIGS